MSGAMERDMKRTLAKFGALATLFVAVGCQETSGVEAEIPGDDEFATFGGAGAKADGRFNDCQMTEVLKVVNESTSNPEALKAMGLNGRAANAIWAHRIGPDGQPGTGDDDLFDDFAELDDVSFVGPVSLEQLVGAVSARCVNDLGRPFMDRNTFANSTGGGFSRDNVELESAMAVRGVPSPRLLEILDGTDSRGRTIFSRLRRFKGMEGLTYDYPVDEVRWDDEAMEVREAMPYVALSIERGRYEPDPEDPDGTRELSLGTDIMDDIYYDTNEHLLLDNGMIVRGRVRWDTRDEIRRLLIAAKFDAAIDEEGLKRAAKIDVRTDSPDRHVASLNTDVQSGTVEWSGRRTPVEPLEAVYRRLEELDVLPDVQGHPDVLLLDPKVHVRSFRSRYHLNEASIDGLKRYHVAGRDRIQSVNDLIDARITAGTLAPAAQAQAEQLKALGASILSGEAVSARLQAAPSTVRPDEFATPTTEEELQNQRQIADIVYDLMHEYARALDDLDNTLAGSDDVDADDHMDMFIAWRKAVDSSLKIKSVARPFLEDYDALNQDKDVAIRDFNEFGDKALADGNVLFEDWSTVTPEIWDGIGKLLTDEDLGNSHRMIATAGIMAKSLWFDKAREFYVPASNRFSFSNFLIDTMDFTKMVSNTEWEAIPEGERKPSTVLPAAKVFHTMLVNEVQIELGSEEPFLQRLEELKTQLESNPDAATEKTLEGARFVFGEYRNTLTTIAEVKGEAILDRLDDEGAPNTAEWAPSEFSKGETGLRILGDRD